MAKSASETMLEFLNDPSSIKGGRGVRQATWGHIRHSISPGGRISTVTDMGKPFSYVSQSNRSLIPKGLAWHTLLVYAKAKDSSAHFLTLANQSLRSDN